MKVLSLVFNLILLAGLVTAIGLWVDHTHETIFEFADPEGFSLSPGGGGYSLAPGFLTSGGTNIVSLVNTSASFGIGSSTPAAKLSILAESGISNFLVGSSSVLGFMDPRGRFGIGASTSLTSLFSLTGSSLRLNENLFLISTSSPTNATGTALVILPSGSVGIATTSPSRALGLVGNALIGGSGTTTLSLDTNGSIRGGCIEMRAASTSDIYRIYIGTNPDSPDVLLREHKIALRVEVGACQ